MVNLRERNLCGKWSSGQVQTTHKNGIDRIYCRYSPKKVFLQHFTRDFARLLQGENDSQVVDILLDFVEIQQVAPTIRG